MKIFHNFHLVDMSPWPLLVGMTFFCFPVSLVNYFVYSEMKLLMMCLVLTLIMVMLWWRDVVRESTFQGFHGMNVVSGLIKGMILFIVSEVFFFLSFFWSFFHYSLSPSVELGMIWPPMGVLSFSIFQVPLLNTIILLSSGISVTLVHHFLLSNSMKLSFKFLIITVLLGIYFLMLQMFEYFSASFDMSSSVYGSIFFMATGFHGFHVLVGMLFLLIISFRMFKLHFSSSHHFGFEAAAWYWHFVDVVWLFLFCVVYWWGS